MAQAMPEKKPHDSTEMEGKNTNLSFKFNAQAPAFVPRTQPQVPISGYIYPYIHYLGCGNVGSNWYYVSEQEPVHFVPNTNVSAPSSPKHCLSDDMTDKIVKQVEYQFSEMSLVASETLMKHMHKNPDGYVPISVIASSKKLKSIVTNYGLVAQALRSSSKLVVSNDGKKVKRKQLFTDRDKEDLQSRTVVAENLPEDYSNQNLEKIFSVVGSVKTIQVCHPEESHGSHSKGDVLISNKPRSVIRGRKSDYDHFDGHSDEDEISASESSENSPRPKSTEFSNENNAEDNSTGSKKGWARGRGKSRGRGQSHIGHSPLLPSIQTCGSIQCETPTKQHTPRGPRMPDGTRGFTMGRGKPVSLLAPVE
ncbi:hypothetical protein GIB67_029680 [Kingdonia uniflora]|uniref:HTH La-type RNA-binding domain-containing protein n=1 Tax=Kingdonia uniflora TaxID=39325 RepID=A0A7J7LLF9_9MAGN|nr:hypothetical protein GIB67_029680 [Kingdonia uniflora]